MKGRRSSVHLSLPSVTHLRLVSVTRPSLPPLAYGSFRREWNERRIRDVEGRHAIHLSSRFLSQSFILRPLESHASYSRSLPSSLRSSRMEGDVRRLTTVTYGEARDGNDQGNSRFAHPSSRYVTPSVVLPPLVHLRPPDRRSRVDEVSERRE